MMLIRFLVVLGLLVGLPGRQPISGGQAPTTPKLLVVVVVDQMRFDYLERMRAHWTGGIKRLLTEGAVFERNAYPYLNTVTCAGHATIGTGSFPATHGIIMNAWWRGTRTASCTDDAGVSSIAYEPGAQPVGHSGAQLLVPTIGDRLREQSPASRVVALSMKPRSAIMLAGHSGVVTWLDDHDVWATSTAFGAAPDATIQGFITANPRERQRQAVWSRLHEPGAYTGTDDAPGEAPPAGWTPTFPHALAGPPDSPPSLFLSLWERSPYADAFLVEMASSVVTGMKLGQGEAVDYLGISFATLDYVGHAFGPDSHEVQDTLMRLDQAMGDLLTALDTQVGRGRYVLGLSADHGVAPIPEARQAAGESGGRVVTQRVAEVANAALVQALGPGQHVARVEYTQVYLSETAQQRVLEDPRILDPAIAAIAQLPGIDRVLRGAGLEGERASPDPSIRAAALSHVPGRSGQIVMVPQPYYVISSATANGTTHGTHHSYDQQVPLIFFGAHVKPGRYQEPSTPADLAPTLAATIGLPMPGADGVVQRQAFTIPDGRR
jgi:predicted AlkP superfamily pyrophosphatase or phosphodiesterase